MPYWASRIQATCSMLNFVYNLYTPRLVSDLSISNCPIQIGNNLIEFHPWLNTIFFPPPIQTPANFLSTLSGAKDLQDKQTSCIKKSTRKSYRRISPEVVDKDIGHPEVVQEPHVHWHRIVGAVSLVRDQPRVIPRNNEEHGQGNAEGRRRREDSSKGGEIELQIQGVRATTLHKLNPHSRGRRHEKADMVGALA